MVTNLYPPGTRRLRPLDRRFRLGPARTGPQHQGAEQRLALSGESSNIGPSGEAVERKLQLKGSYQGGVRHLEDPEQRQIIDRSNIALIRAWLNSQNWDGILLGNLDLLGAELLPALLEAPLHRSTSRWFRARALSTECLAPDGRYRLVAASKAVRAALVSAGLPTSTASVVYPGVRSELFGVEPVGMPCPLPPDGSRQRPLKVCFAGLLMGSKGAHTL